MDMVLRSFNVVKDGKTISHYELFKRGSVREIRTSTEVIYTGAYAEQEFRNCLETNKQIASMIGAEVVIEK